MDPQPAPATISQPTPAKRRFFARPIVWIAAAVLVVLIAAGSVAAIVVLPNQCNLFDSSRHGLACDVPLPPNATYDHMGTSTQLIGTSNQGNQQVWVFVVSNTTPEQVDAFYQAQLPARGWTDYTSHNFSAFAGYDLITISAQKGKESLFMGADANPDFAPIPPGGIDLAINFSS